VHVIRSWGARAGREFAIPGLILMENAGEGCARLIEELLADPGSEIRPPFQVVCGCGNNGGDGLVIARHLSNRGLETAIHFPAPPSRIDPASDAGVHLEIARRMGIPIHADGSGLALEGAIRRATEAGTVIDAIFGTGLSRPVAAPELEWIEGINRSGLPVLAVDIPSGLDADSGRILGAAVRARHTFTFAAPKLGFARGAGPACAGRVRVVGISIPRALIRESMDRAPRPGPP
jgi:NAD(P)H-hydrate epimerase